jgi:NADH-quinone oxidoreductase subunit N
MTPYGYVPWVLIAGFTLLSLAGIAAPLLGRRGSLVLACAAMLFTGFATLAATLVAAKLELGYGVLSGLPALLVWGAALSSALVVLGSYEVYSAWRWGEAVPAVAALIVLGALAIALAGDMLTLYAGWILAAAASYVVVGLAKDSVSAEAAVKYAALGGLASAFLVAGLGLIFAGSGSLQLKPVGEGVFALAAAAFVLTSAGFKIGAVPYHGWVPDVYGNARPMLVAVVSPLAKVVAVILAVKLLDILPSEPSIVALVAGVAAVTMTYGNAAAAVSERPQLILAYSSIAQAGYLVAGLVALKLAPEAARLALLGIALHSLGYVFSKAASFLAIDATGAKTWSNLRGLWRRDPVAALGLTLGLASLLGVPPALGFWGKLYIVLALASYALPLVIVMAANFALGAYYYARMINAVFEAGGSVEARTCWRSVFSLTLGLLSILLGFLPWLGTLAYR